MRVIQIGMDAALEIEKKGKADSYKAFEEKFEVAKTTDDCYTPPTIYQIVLDWVVKEYGVDPDRVIRPFFPGMDYEHTDYPQGCVVVDNPPFSILSAIVRFYMDRNIGFFLFCPSLTNLNLNLPGLTHIGAAAPIIYENKANVNTSFLTNLDGKYEVRSAPDLHEAIEAEAQRLAKVGKKELPKYTYPDNVLTAAMVNYMSVHGIDYRLRFGESVFIRALDAQRKTGKGIFGAGLLLSEKATAEKAAAEKAAAEKAAAEKAAAEKAAATIWELSEREKEIIRKLGNGEK